MAGEALGWLTVWVRELPLALPLEQVQEIVLWVPWQQGPPGRKGCVGVLTVRGEAWPVWDLGRFWGWNPRDPEIETCYVLMNTSDGERLGAVIVDRVGWIVDDASPTRSEGMKARRAGFAETILDSASGTEHFVTRLTELSA